MQFAAFWCSIYLFIYYEIVQAVHVQKYMKIHIKSITQYLVEFLK